MAANISSGLGLGITRPGRGEADPVKPAASAVSKAAKAQKIKSIKIKFKVGKKEK